MYIHVWYKEIPENVVGVSDDLGGDPLGSVPPPFGAPLDWQTACAVLAA